MSASQAATRRGHEFAQNAERSLREGKIEDAKMWHKNAWNAFKEARDNLMEGDTNTKMALKILIDYHRDREKNPGDPRQSKVSQGAVSSRAGLVQQKDPARVIELGGTLPATSSSTGSLSEAWGAVQEFGELVHNAGTPPPLPDFVPTPRSTSGGHDWKKGQQSMMMAESFLLVGGESLPQGSAGFGSSNPARSVLGGVGSPDRLQAQGKGMASEVERLTKEVQQLRGMLVKEREESKNQRDKFWRMFVLVKAALEESNHESDLKALTRLLHAETEARKKAEADLDNLRRNFA